MHWSGRLSYHMYYFKEIKPKYLVPFRGKFFSDHHLRYLLIWVSDLSKTMLEDVTKLFPSAINWHSHLQTAKILWNQKPRSYSIFFSVPGYTIIRFWKSVQLRELLGWLSLFFPIHYQHCMDSLRESLSKNEHTEVNWALTRIND